MSTPTNHPAPHVSQAEVIEQTFNDARDVAMGIGHFKEYWFPMTARRLRRVLAWWDGRKTTAAQGAPEGQAVAEEFSEQTVKADAFDMIADAIEDAGLRYGDSIVESVEKLIRDRDIPRAEAAGVQACGSIAGGRALPARVPDGLIDALRRQRQVDEDGTECGVDREAVHVAINILASLNDPLPPSGAVKPEDWDAPETIWTRRNLAALLCLRTHDINAGHASFRYEGLNDGGNEIGSWLVTVQKTDSPAPPDEGATRYDWTQAPEWAMFAAVNEDGTHGWFEEQPQRGGPYFPSEWWVKGGKMKFTDRTGPCLQWRETLEQRPTPTRSDGGS